MPPSIPALVEPSVLEWARRTAGYDDPVGAARKIHVPDDRVAQWERGEVPPTIAQLRKAAGVYNRKLAVFFLAEPPADFDTMRDFRRLDGATSGDWSPHLHAEYRRAHVQRDCLLELAELGETEIITAWKVSASGDSALADAAREMILNHVPPALRSAPRAGQYSHVNRWTAGLEEAGILVMATARGEVAVDEMRAFSLYFDVLPVIVVNGADSPRGRLFSLIHEYAHLLLNTAGLCDATADLGATTPDRRLEARCNAIAAEMLMPADLVLQATSEHVRDEEDWDYRALQAAAAPFGVSAEAFLRRLATLGIVTDAYYARRRDEFIAAYQQDDVRTPGAGDWYRNKVRDMGKGYVRTVAKSWSNRVIDSTTAARFLDAKVNQIPRLAATAAVADR